MPRYVDIESLGVGECKRDVFIVPEYADGWNSLFKIIKDAPTADVQEVKHGHWSCVNEDECNYMCDGDEGCGRVLSLVLGSPEDYDIVYCPFCGAKMDENEDEQ